MDFHWVKFTVRKNKQFKRIIKISVFVIICLVLFTTLNLFIIPIKFVRGDGWGSRILITDDNLNNTGVSGESKIVIDSSQNIHIIWSDNSAINESGTDYDIFYKMWDSSTDNWGPRILITDDNTNNTGWSDNPSIARDISDNLHVVWSDSSNLNDSGTDYDIFYRKWNSLTSNWEPRILITDDNINNTRNSRHPSITTDSIGNVHVVWYDESNLNDSGIDEDIFYRKWDVTSSAWGSRVLITNDNVLNVKNSGGPSVTTDPLNNVHVVWYDVSDLDSSGSDYDIFYKKWNNQTSNWGSRILITDDNLNNINLSIDPKISSDNENNIHVVWQDKSDLDGSGSDYDIYYKKWNSSSSNWETRILVTDDNINNTLDSWYPVVATDFNNNVHISWQDKNELDGSGTDYDIFYKKWVSASSNWEARTLITDDNINNTRGSHTPDIAIDYNNDVHIVWHDYSNLNGSGIDGDVFYKKWAQGIKILRITSTIPARDECKVDPKTNITVTFNMAVDKTSVEDGFNYTDGTTIWTKNDGIFTWTNGDRTFIFNPFIDLIQYTRFTVTISGDILNFTGLGTLDGNGNGIEEGSPVDDYIWNFTTGFIIQLYSGWNMISIPLEQIDTSIETVLDSKQVNYDSVQWYNATDINDTWKHFKINKPLGNDLIKIDHLMGFWIYMNAPDTLLVGGEIKSSVSIQLNRGWNLVGYPSFTTRLLTDTALPPEVEIVEYYNTTDNLDHWKSSLNDDLTHLEPTHGYWMYVTDDCLWTINN